MKVEIIFGNGISFRQYLKYFKLQILVFLRNNILFYFPFPFEHDVPFFVV